MLNPAKRVCKKRQPPHHPHVGPRAEGVVTPCTSRSPQNWGLGGVPFPPNWGLVGVFCALRSLFKPRCALLLIAVAACLACWSAGADSQPQAARPFVEFDFVRGADALGWTAAHDVTRMQATREGLRIDIGGGDPYVYAPARDYPANQPLWLIVRCKSDRGGEAQVFYFRDGPIEKDSVHFDCRPGVWEEARIPLPALGKGYRLRFDPPADTGSCVIARISAQARTNFAEPEWPEPDPPNPVNDKVAIQSGDLRLVIASAQWNDFVLTVDGHPMAIGHTRPLIGVIEDGRPAWIEIGKEVKAGRAVRIGASIESTVTLAEPGGALWRIRQSFSAAAVPGAIEIKTEVTADRDRNVLHLPMLVILPGSRSFGASKDHALFAGLEYLDANEPSSSEADIIGPGSHRQVPDSMKSTLPLMAVEKDGRYIGLAWKPDPAYCALFDSPDRRLKSGGHALGILYPGSDGHNREEGSLLPYEPKLLRAGQTLTLYATILGGKGIGVVPAVQQYVALRGLPPLPKTGLSLQKYVDQAAAGWLDSGAGEGGRYRHALPGDFKPQPAADAAVYMDWLAGRTANAALAARLRTAAEAALAQTPGTELNFAGVGHVRYPVPALAFGHVEENIERAREFGIRSLKQFSEDGTIPYRRAANGPDYSRTHFAPDANGLTAPAVLNVLEAASLCGDPKLIRRGLRYLSALDKFAGSAPRGAQTWEVPLHTPDILASAYLVRAFTLGYVLSGEAHFLDSARYWAWTGVPFVYLTQPLTEPAQAESGGISQAPLKGDTADPIGVYSTIAVYGATQWIAPNWMGRPVQWCGLVYADALYRLSKYDANPVWKTVADGITLSGIQQTWPRGADSLRQGLLPDSVSLRGQTRFDPAINPGTLEANAVQLWTGSPLYDVQSFHAGGLVLVHAPGKIRDIKDEPGRILFTVVGWPERTYGIIVVGLKKPPQITVNGKPTGLTAPNHYSGEAGSLILHLSGRPTVEIKL